MYSFPDLEPYCFMSSSNCCFLTCIQISQEAGKVVRYSHLSKMNSWVFKNTHSSTGSMAKPGKPPFGPRTCFYCSGREMEKFEEGEEEFLK